jgi:hypothetical protein
LLPALISLASTFYGNSSFSLPIMFFLCVQLMANNMGCLLSKQRAKKMGYYHHPQQPNSYPAIHTLSPFNPLRTKRSNQKLYPPTKNTQLSPQLFIHPNKESSLGESLVLNPDRDETMHSVDEKKLNFFPPCYT